MSDKSPKVHFIANGSSIVHDLALNLQQIGYSVSVSDNSLNETVDHKGLTIHNDWNTKRISKELDMVIPDQKLGADNPELQEAQKLGLTICSVPEFIFQKSINKQRIVITGTHGKTTTTAMIMHVLKHFNKDFDYLVGSLPEGFESHAKLTKSAPIIIIEGSECPATPIDPTPEFLYYNHHIGLISGVEWRYADIYGTFDEYVKQFEKFADATPKAGILVFNENDDVATLIGRKEREDVQRVEYKTADFEINNNQTTLINGKEKIALNIFGKLNIKNLSGARALCAKMGITEEMFNQAIGSFKGVKDRLEVLGKTSETVVVKDVAHSPATLKASTTAVNKQYPEYQHVAVYELNPEDKQNSEYFKQYKDCLKGTDLPVIFISKKAATSSDELKKVFNKQELKVFNEANALKEYLASLNWKQKSLLLMSPSDFGGINSKTLAQSIL
ncbi:Mur ligase family protein [Cytophagaceae bacterium ABcell3]|nr:Mur ligase family protein [Cytophagaceae bacterium ABcell3]